MAGGRALCICLLAVAVRSEEEDSGSRVMRRELRDTQLHVVAKGELSGASKRQDPQDAQEPWCDLYYPLGIENSNECSDKTGGGKKGEIIDEELDCKEAAAALHLAFNNSDFLVHDYNYVDIPAPFPKKCFKLGNQIHFNPSGATSPQYPPTKGITGTPICADKIYMEGTSALTKDALCTGDYELITTWEECSWAHDCEYGGMECEEVASSNTDYQSNEAVVGCFRNWAEGEGCFGFNSKPAASWTPGGQSDWKAKTLNTTPVCRLKTHTFNGHPKCEGSSDPQCR
jgi:hypothetical protein